MNVKLGGRGGIRTRGPLLTDIAFRERRLKPARATLPIFIL